MNIAILGASGMVGKKILDILEERAFPVDNLYLYSSSRSAGQELKFKGQTYTLIELDEHAFDPNIDIAFFAAGGAISEEYSQLARDKGVTVIDNSSVYRMNQEVPLIVPEINKDMLGNSSLIANPNCSTIQSVMALAPLQKFGIKRVVYTTYQAVSGSGVGGVKDLNEGTTDTYPYKIKTNVLPHIDTFMDNGYTKEEMKMINETKKILNDNNIKISATTVRVPIENGHAVNIDIEFDNNFDIDEIYEAYENSEGIIVQDNIKEQIYPITDNANGTDEVYVGRIRRDYSIENGLHVFAVADNIRKGAATNSVQIAEALINNN